MWASAAGAGVVIGGMALLKIFAAAMATRSPEQTI